MSCRPRVANQRLLRNSGGRWVLQFAVPYYGHSSNSPAESKRQLLRKHAGADNPWEWSCITRKRVSPARFVNRQIGRIRPICRIQLPAPSFQLPTPNSQLPTPNSQLPAPNSNSQLPTPSFQLPASTSPAGSAPCPFRQGRPLRRRKPTSPSGLPCGCGRGQRGVRRADRRSSQAGRTDGECPLW